MVVGTGMIIERICGGGWLRAKRLLFVLGVCVDGTSASERTRQSSHQAGHQCGVVQVASAAAAAASACISSSSFTHGRVHRAENAGASYAALLHTFKARDYLMIVPALLYALYNNLTFNNLKTFDANIVQVRPSPPQRCPRSPPPLPAPPSAAHERPNRHHWHAVLLSAVPPLHLQAVGFSPPPPHRLQVSRTPSCALPSPPSHPPLSVASVKGSVTMPSVAMVTMVAVQATLSSLSSVYIEKLLKHQVSLLLPSPSPLLLSHSCCRCRVPWTLSTSRTRACAPPPLPPTPPPAPPFQHDARACCDMRPTRILIAINPLHNRTHPRAPRRYSMSIVLNFIVFLSTGGQLADLHQLSHVTPIMMLVLTLTATGAHAPYPHPPSTSPPPHRQPLSSKQKIEFNRALQAALLPAWCSSTSPP